MLQVAAAGLDILGQHVHAAHQIVGVAGNCLAQQFRIGQNEIRRRQRIGDLPHIELGLLPGVRVEAGGVAHQLVRPSGGEQIGLFEKVEELVRAPFRIGKALVGGGSGDDGAGFLAGEALGGRGPQIEVGLAQPGLQFDRALRVCEPVLGDLAKRFDDLGDLVGHFAIVFALFAGLQVRRQRPAAIFDQVGQIARQGLDINRADLHLLLRWRLHRRSSAATGKFNRTIPTLFTEMAFHTDAHKT